MINLLLAIVAGALVALAMRFGEKKSKNAISFLAVNYLLCLILSLLFSGMDSFTPEPVSTLLGMLQGLLYLACFLLLQFNISKNGVVLSSTFMRLGLLVPITVSVLLFHEIPSLLQTIGFLVAIIAILMINLEKGTGQANFKLGLIILLLSGGATDVMAKIYDEYGTSSLKNQFILFTFLTAFLLCIGLALHKRQSLAKEDILCGLLLGIPNYLSAVFLLGAVHELPAVIVYPTFSVATIVLVSLCGIFFFKEKLSRRQFMAIGLILIALFLLNI